MSTLSKTTFEAVAWSFSSASIALTLGRFFIRKRLLGKFYWDDLTHGLALAVSIAFVACYTITFPLLLAVERWKSKEGPEPSTADILRFVHFDVTVQLLGWMTIYLVKLSLLLFYRTIFGVSRPFLTVWWAVLVFTLISFGVCFFSPLWVCATPAQLFVLKVCLSQKAFQVTNTFAEVGCALNVTSDLLIMALPLWMLKGLKMSRGRKIALTALFMLAFLDIAFDVIRIGLEIGGGIVTSASIFDVLEPVVAVIVSTLPAYRALFKDVRKREISSYKTLKATPISSSGRTAGSIELLSNSSGWKHDEEEMVTRLPRTPVSVESKNARMVPVDAV